MFIRNSAKVILPSVFVVVLTASVFGQAASRPAQASTDAPLTITLQDALERARANSVPFHAALTDHGVARQDKVQARAALLPSVNFTNTATYTQGNGTSSGVFLANNGVHEYLSQADVHEAFTFAGLSDLKRTGALEAVAKAKAEIAARGLVVTVVQSYYGLVASQRKYANTQQAGTEAQHFLELSRKLEKGGEVAHSDVIKAQIQAQDRQRDLREAQLAMEKSRLELAVLLFPNFTENFTVVDDLDLAPPLRSFDDILVPGRKGTLTCGLPLLPSGLPDMRCSQRGRVIFQVSPWITSTELTLPTLHYTRPSRIPSRLRISSA